MYDLRYGTRIGLSGFRGLFDAKTILPNAYEMARREAGLGDAATTPAEAPQDGGSGGWIYRVSARAHQRGAARAERCAKIRAEAGAVGCSDLEPPVPIPCARFYRAYRDAGCSRAAVRALRRRLSGALPAYAPNYGYAHLAGFGSPAKLYENTQLLGLEAQLDEAAGRYVGTEDEEATAALAADAKARARAAYAAAADDTAAWGAARRILNAVTNALRNDTWRSTDDGGGRGRILAASLGFGVLVAGGAWAWRSGVFKGLGSKGKGGGGKGKPKGGKRKKR